MDDLVKPERVVDINNALRVEWYAGDAIVAYVPLEMTQRVLRTWSNTALDILREWPLEKPYLALYDLSERGVIFRYSFFTTGNMFSLGLTEEGEAQVAEIVAPRENFTARIAMNTSLRHSGYVGGVQAKYNILKQAHKQTARYDIFYEKQAAFKWLMQTE